MSDYFESENSEFVAVFGRRRVGKTFLIRETFETEFAFYFTGSVNSNLKNQLQNFNAALNKYGTDFYSFETNWFKAFEQLSHLLEKLPNKNKKIIFLDEVPWMDTPRSGFLPALEYFWNGWASSRKDILLIVCGSATSWMTNNLLKNRGGLHNRVTQKMYVAPFTLKECELYFKEKNIAMSRYQIAESYMVLGGVPFYLSLLDKNLSLAQNIDQLCFSPHGILKDEFSNLYASLFKNSQNHIKIIEALSKKTKGMTQSELSDMTKISDGGGLVKIMDELEQCGFIRKYHTFGQKKGYLYQLIDFYTLFYYKFIKDNAYFDEIFWLNSIDSAQHRSWSGFAFEQVCISHTRQMKKRLGISGVLTNISAWRSKKYVPGAQIDLIIDRKDDVINLCEIKYAGAGLFSINKKDSENLSQKKAAFISETGTKKAVHLTMVTTYGISKNMYSGMVQSEIILDDLFED